MGPGNEFATCYKKSANTLNFVITQGSYINQQKKVNTISHVRQTEGLTIYYKKICKNQFWRRPEAKVKQNFLHKTKWHQQINQKVYRSVSISIFCPFVYVYDVTYVEIQSNHSKLHNFISLYKICKTP